MKNSMSENTKWLVALGLAAITAQLVAAIIAKVYDEHYPAPPLLAHLHDAAESGLTLLLPAAVALAWLVRVVWRRLHVRGPLP
jgi:hypothetical protein